MARSNRAFPTKAVLSVGLLNVLVPSIAECAHFPPELLGKSVTVVWTASHELRNDLGQTYSTGSNNDLRIYISTAGRAFTKFRTEGIARNNRGMVWENRQAPDGSASSDLQKLSVHFEGGALVADSLMMTGARRFSITFDPSYSNCKLRVMWGKERGVPIRQRSIFYSNRTVELLSAKPAGPANCSVTLGNVFAAGQ